MAKIGVILNQYEEIASLMEGTQVAIYEKIASKWTNISVVKDSFLQKDSLAQMRGFLSNLIVELQDCKILIGTVIAGIPYMILDKEGIMLCEADIMSEELFTTVERDYVQMEQKMNDIADVKVIDYPSMPYETGECGVYELDMRKLQEAHPELSSKMALIPFLKKTKFTRLDVYCSHVMPWLDAELLARGLIYYVDRLANDGYKVAIKLA